MKTNACTLLMLLLCLTVAIGPASAEYSGDRPPADVQVADAWAEEALARPLAGMDEIVFAVRSVIPEHWYANFGYFSPDACRKCYGKGGRLCKLNLRTGKLIALVDDPEGAVRDPCVDYDGQRIVFSYRRGGTDTYHLWEIQADGNGLKQRPTGATTTLNRAVCRTVGSCSSRHAPAAGCNVG